MQHRCARGACPRGDVALRIAQIAPLAEAVPPKLYGGTERVIWWLTEALVDLGHDVTLYRQRRFGRPRRGSCPALRAGLRLAGINDHTASLLAMLDRVRRDATSFDILHFHIDFLHFPTFRHMAGQVRDDACTGGSICPISGRPFAPFPKMKLVSISDNQRTPIAEREFRRDHPSRPAAEPDPVRRRRRRLSRLHRPHFAREAARPGDRDRQARPA